MTRFLVYTSPARGHLYPLVPTLSALVRRGHEVHLRTLAREVARMTALGFAAKPIAAEIERREMDDWRASSPPAALRRATRTFIDRAPHEVADLRRAVDEVRPDALYVDCNAWGALAVAEASSLRWAMFAPYFLPFRGAGIPPWGMGLPPSQGRFGRLRDAILWRVLQKLHDAALPDLNRVRVAAGASPLDHVADYVLVPPRLVYHTAEPFEYPRPWPSHVRLVGPGLWEPDATEPPTQQTEGARPLVLVTCSTEFQDDGGIIAGTLAALANEPVDVVATTGALDPAHFSAPPNARVERFLPHGPLLARAACVVCHGGMGITQKALAAGVPVCVVPFGRDQLEVARHVEVAGAGVRRALSSQFS